MASKWQRSIYWRAFEEARSSLGVETGERALIAVAVVVIAFTVVWLVAGWDIAKSQLPIILSSSATFILIFSLVYVRKLFTIPAKSFQIILGKRTPYETVEPSGVNRNRIVRVKLQNNTNTEINGELHLRNLDPPNDAFKNFLLEDRITIGRHNNTFIGVAAYSEGTSESLAGPWIQLIIPNPGGYCMPATYGHLPLRSHTFHLRFSSLDDIFDEVYCRIFLDSYHVLHLEEWS